MGGTVDEGSIDEGPVCVYEANVVEAEMVRALLEGNGIRAGLLRSGSGAYPVAVGAMGAGRVLVAPGDRDRALRVIGAADAGDLELDEGDRAPRGWLVAAVTAAIAIGLVLLLLGLDLPK